MNTHASLPRRARPIRRSFFAAMLLGTLLGANPARGADANPPARMTYQGFLVDGNGVPLASTKVENYDVVFRIYDASQGGNILWTEQQTVTVDQGNFSILLGEGTAVGSEPRPSLEGVFSGATASDRYVGITVKNLGGGDADILPRLRLLTTPYAFLARNATSLVGPTGQPLITTAAGTIQSAGGAVRGPGAVDLQNTRVENDQVASGSYSVVAGGQNNKASSFNATVSGGVNNRAEGLNSSVGGGIENLASGITATIGGGYQNFNSGSDSVIAGGHRNTNTAFSASIGGGQYNLAGANLSTVAGGFKNQATAVNAFIGGGAENKSQGMTATIGGGFKNTASALESVVGGGSLNQATGDRSAVTAGLDNRSSGVQSFIGGGHTNKATGINAAVSGGFANTAGGYASHVGAGELNQATGNQSAVAGGMDNRAANERSVVGGGHLNVSSGINSFIGGGYSNVANNNEATVGGGNINVAGGLRSTVAGGIDNQASGSHAAIGGGHFNRAPGVNAAVPGGYNNLAQGDHSLAAGRRAKANHHGSFVWADSTDKDFTSEFPNSFFVRASGGFVIYTTPSANFEAGLKGVHLPAGQVAWVTFSDRNMKKNFTPIDEKEVLEKLANLPVQRWHYIGEDDESTQHIGPTAQDFMGAFYPGRDDKGISTLEFDGVELAAIKGLHQLVKEKETEIQSMKDELRELRSVVEGLAKERANVSQ